MLIKGVLNFHLKGSKSSSNLTSGARGSLSRGNTSNTNTSNLFYPNANMNVIPFESTTYNMNGVNGVG